MTRANAIAERADRLKGFGSELTTAEKNASQEFRQLLELLGETMREIELPRQISDLEAKVAELRTALDKAQGFAGRADVSITPPAARDNESN